MRQSINNPCDDVRDISEYRKTGEVTAQMPESSEVPVQATSWHRNTQGKIELIAAQSTHIQPYLTCGAQTEVPAIAMPRASFVFTKLPQDDY